MTKVGFVSLGCSKNLVDTEIMIGQLNAAGYEIVADEQKADIIIVNTCAFIDSAKEEAINTILELAHLKESGSLKKLIVTGCLSERYKEEILKELPEVDAVVGVGRFDEISEVINSDDKIFLGNKERLYPEGAPRITTTPKYMAYLKIAEGCDNNCTYCAIPMIRGKYRSRKIESIISEAETLAKDGVVEIIVIAQDTSRYGEDICKKQMLPHLLEKLSRIEGIEWIRVLYTYPERITDELISVISENEKVSTYFDIPIQHINDRILKRMNRKCSKNEIYELINNIRAKVPEAVLRTSLITGFPGETEDEFNELCDFVKWAQFDRLGVFAYSREEGTPADKLDNHLPDTVKTKRADAIMKIQQEISAQKCKKKIGITQRVLVEGKYKDKYVGRTICDAPDIDGKVIFTSDNKIQPGEFVYVKINNSGIYDLIGVETDEFTE